MTVQGALQLAAEHSNNLHFVGESAVVAVLEQDAREYQPTKRATTTTPTECPPSRSAYDIHISL